MNGYRAHLRQSAAAFRNQWNEYFFGEASLNSLALYRVLVCAVIFAEGASWFPYAKELFSNEWFHVRYVTFSAQMATTDAYILTGMLMVCSLSACVGYFTRLNLSLTLVIYALLHSVDSLNEKAVETVVMIVLVMLILSPCDTLWSVDVLRGTKKRVERGPIFFQRLLQWQFAQTYFFCGLTKMVSPDWANGIVFLDSINGRWASDFGVWFAGQLSNPMIRAFGTGTILFELFIGGLLLTPHYRTFAVIMAAGFHLGIEATLNIGSLGWQFLAADLCLFLYPDVALKYVQAARGFFSRQYAKAHEIYGKLRPTASSDGEAFS